MAVTPEEIGLGGCWQVIAVERTALDLASPTSPPHASWAAISSSLAGRPIRGRGDVGRDPRPLVGQRNGTHYRRDVSLGEDACRTTARQGAAVLACLRNLVIGIYELERAAKRTTVATF